MTPEERLTRIERVLQSLTDAQVEHAAQIEKQNAGIRDLIIVSRSVLTSMEEFRETQRKDHEEWTAQMKELRDAQAVTDEKLNILIHTVDRIIRSRNGSGDQA